MEVCLSHFRQAHSNFLERLLQFNSLMWKIISFTFNNPNVWLGCWFLVIFFVWLVLCDWFCCCCHLCLMLGFFFVLLLLFIQENLAAFKISQIILNASWRQIKSSPDVLGAKDLWFQNQFNYFGVCELWCL